MTLAEVTLWGTTIGAIEWDDTTKLGHFEYRQDFIGNGIEPAPLTMPTSKEVYTFGNLPETSFHGLPGMLADSLPDDYGNAIINAWLAGQGRMATDFNPVERLCYTGNRGIGALEYKPSIANLDSRTAPLQIAKLVELASSVLNQHQSVTWKLDGSKHDRHVKDILKVGTSAGGARAKAIIAWDPDTGEIRSGHIDAPEGFEHWLLKFDGVSGGIDNEHTPPKNYGLIEFAYYHMALVAGITMSKCHILEESGRKHFMTRRFDRPDNGDKIHMQSLGAMCHFDYKKPGAYAYEQALQTIKKLQMPAEDLEQQFRRMAFNIIGRNQDDHVKNIAFLMDRSGTWRLAPAYDVTYSYNPGGIWTGTHQMTLNGKRDNFEFEDFMACAKTFAIADKRAKEIIGEVQDAISKWHDFAMEAGISEEIANQIGRTHRINML